MPSPTPTAKPAGNLTSGQFINIQKLHIAKMLTDEAGGTATYEKPIPLGKLLRKVDIKPQTNQAELFADGQSVDTASNTASYDLTFDTRSVFRRALSVGQAQREEASHQVLQSPIPRTLGVRQLEAGEHSV